MPTVRVENLTKKFGKHVAVDDISFTVEDGTFTTLLGPSGCGKTTTLRMLAGFLNPDSGQIRIGDKLMANGAGRRNLVPPERRNVGVVFQSYALWPHMTAFDQVAYPLRIRRRRRVDIRDRVHATLSLVGLGGMGEKYPAQLSGGQQQRVALARALVFEPAVLLLDEPLSNLDAELRKQMRDELARIHDQLKMTFVYVTHDQSEALALSDQVLVMRDGHVLERGSPVEVYREPHSAYSARFVGGANCIPAKVVDVRGDEVTAKLSGGETISGVGHDIADAHVGSDVLVTVKPNDIALGAAVTASNRLAGVVRSLSYLGPYVEVTVEVSGQRLVMHARQVDGLAIDSPVTLGMGTDAVRIIQPAPSDN
jgi:iron(III) transport system ATP-binding protein